jgi:P27 family predicted phage terminase small subunit
MPVLQPTLDRHIVTRYCEAAEDAIRARVEISRRGLVIDEVIPDPRGGVAGYRPVLNPAEGALRRADRVLTELGDRLGLSPASRARLGLTISQAELAQSEAQRILSGMFRPPAVDAEGEDDDDDL